MTDNDRLTINDSNRLYQTLIETMPSGLSIDNTEGRVVYVNPSLCRMLGYAPEELEGHSILDILAGWSDDTVREKLDNRREGVIEYYDAQLIHKSGRLVPVQVSAAPLFDEAGEFVGTFAIFVDQSDIEDSKMMAERSQRMYSQLFHQSKDAIIIHDPDGCIIDVNQRAMELFGHARSAFVGKDVRELVHPDSVDQNKPRPRNLLSDGAYHDEVSFVGTSGEVFPAELSATLIDTGTDQVVQAIVRDLSGQRRAQQMLRAMSNRALLYLDILSHDISNHLQVVKSTTELLSLRCDGEIEVRLLEDMKRACRKMEGIVAKTKATGQLMVTTLSNRDLIQAVERTTELAKQVFPECSFSISYLVDRAAIKADDLLDHLIFNLLENAFEHNPGEDRRIWVTVDSESAGYRLSVADNGSGIPDDVKVSLLEPSRRKGGLGLHMSRHIAEKYGGNLWIENRVEEDVGRGAEVIVWFPAASHCQMLS